jgi:hypothetical protein
VPVCSVCGQLKPLDKFPRNGVKNGIEQRRKDCTTCYNVTRRTNSKKGKAHLKKFANNMWHRTGEVVMLSLDDWRAVLIWFEGRCAYCGKQQSRSIRLTKDHIVPCVEGGTTCRYNIIPACTTCNCSKGATGFEIWFKKQPFYSVKRHARIVVWQKGGR